MNYCRNMKEHLPVLEINVEFLLLWKSLIKSHLKKHINKSKLYIKNSSPSAKKKNLSGTPLTRVCCKCGEEKPLNTEHYQRVDYFKRNYSYYCNICNAPKPRD